MNRKESWIRNLMLTVLAAIMLLGFALAVPSGDMNDEWTDAAVEEEEDSGEYDFL